MRLPPAVAPILALVAIVCGAGQARAAVVTRFFSTTSAGAADGTTWADRAALFSAGNWSTVITGFNFSGTDSLLALAGPGAYTCSQSLTSGVFTNAPTFANPLVVSACDSSGNVIAPPSPAWMSDQPAWSTAALPVIATTTNIATSTLTNACWVLVNFTASGRNGSVISAGISLAWCQVTNSTANTAAIAVATTPMQNCFAQCTGSSYSCVVQTPTILFNVRISGVTGSSGNRHGVDHAAASTVCADFTTIIGVGGTGYIVTTATTSSSVRIDHCVFANNTGAGFQGNSAGSQTGAYAITNSMITGHGGWGIDGQSGARILVFNNRMRNNTSGNITGLGNYPTTLYQYTTAATDAAEYVNAGSGNYQIKSSATIANMGFGVSQQAASSTVQTSAGYAN
jgi:hypothetical protein